MPHPLTDKLIRRAVQIADGVAREAIAEAERLTGTSYPPASAPGQPPHRRSGQVNRGFTHDVTVTGTRINARVTNRAPHWKYLVAGAKRMAPRPVLTAEFNAKYRRRFIERFKAARTAAAGRR